MDTVKLKSYAKINLALEVLGVENGYHNIESLVTNIDLFDVLTVKRRKGKFSVVKMHGMGSESIPPEENNALKAAEAFSQTFGTDGADIAISKNIPIGAGLGGSSADVVGVLNGMARLYGVDDRNKLKSLADSLGSDTGYMLNGGWAVMAGRGEKVTPQDLTNKLHFLLLCPKTSVSSKACYQMYDTLPRTLEWRENATQACISALQRNDLNGIGRYLTNDLFAASAHLNPDVLKAKEECLSFSPLGAVMTGSGSGVLALFPNREFCEWAKSRYRGKFAAYVVETIVPDYAPNPKKPKKPSFFRNPFVLSDEEKRLGE